MKRSRTSRWSTYNAEKRLLLDFINHCPGKYVIEIGAFRGKTTATLAGAAAIANKQVWVIDPWNGYYDADEAVFQSFLATTRQWKRWITVVRSKSQDAQLSTEMIGKCALVFIDGDHAGDAPYQDMRKFWPFVSNGGVMAIHDYFDARHRLFVQRGVQRFIAEQPRPLTLMTLQVFATDAERKRHQTRHSTPGIAWFKKESI